MGRGENPLSYNWPSLGHVPLPVGQSDQEEPLTLDQLESLFQELGRWKWSRHLGADHRVERSLHSVPDWGSHAHRWHQAQQIWWLLRTKQCGFPLEKSCVLCLFLLPPPPHIPMGREAEESATVACLLLERTTTSSSLDRLSFLFFSIPPPTTTSSQSLWYSCDYGPLAEYIPQFQ